MKIRNKILIILSCIVMTVMITGLSVGVVLVSNAEPVAKSMQVTYSAKKVSCIIGASGWLHNEEVTEINVYGVTTVTIDGDRRNTKQSINFADAVLGNCGKGYAVYIFSITNITKKGECDIKVTASLLDTTQGYNITVKMGENEESAVETNNYCLDSIKYGQTKSLCIIMSVTDACLDAMLDADILLQVSESLPTSIN